MRPDRARRPTGQAGVTLIELMIAMVILGIAITAALSVGYTMINGYRDSRRAVAVERAARGALTFLSTAVRAASPGVPSAAITDVVGCDTWQGLQVIDNDGAPDELYSVYASGRVVTSLRQAFDQDSTSMVVVDGDDLNAGDYVLVVNPGAAGHLVAIDGSADNGDGTWTLSLPGSPSSTCPAVAAFSYGATSLVIRAKLAHFYVDTTGLPLLMMDPDGAGPEPAEPVAEGIEDLQIAVGIDNDPTDESLTELGAAAGDDEWQLNVAGETLPIPLASAGNWRALRLTITARSLVETSNATDSIRPAAENRIAGTAGDAHRRRTMSTTVEIRNLQGSP